MFFIVWFIFFIQSAWATPLDEFQRVGYVEFCDKKQDASFDTLYTYFDELIEFLHTNPSWSKKLFIAKERFIRSKDRNIYSTDFFGLFDDSAKHQISFYYSTHFHEFVCSHYKEFNKIPEFTHFLDACRDIQSSFNGLYQEVVAELNIEAIYPSTPPILFKVVKYLPSYRAARPHFDGTAFTLFLDSTDNQSLLLAPYKASLSVDDFSTPHRGANSVLLIPGAMLSEFSINPTPHIVVQNGKVRYSTIAFAMRPNYSFTKREYSILPNF